MAQHVGLDAVRERLRADAGVRCRDWQHPARRAVSIQLESDLDLHRQLHQLFNPFAILCGALSVAMSMYMGAVTIMNGGEGAMHDRARKLAVWAD